MALALRHPDIGEMIGDYKVVGLLGAGGLGVVYKVERGGRFFALKLLLLSQLDGRARREIGILIHLENPYVVRYVGSDFWPDLATGHPYIVMEYVPGDTLWTFAYKENPSARKATRLLLDTALTLGEVHAAGVFHRDVKPENILIRSGSERPILIDFGIGSLAGAPPVTGSVLPPGTEEFRSPEQIRFQRANPDGTAHFEYGPADELWALGVTYYWLLTDVLPFGERTDEEGLAGLRERILTRRPIAPHLLNPRVPLAASLLCMKMLAERPEERFPGVAPLCAALNEALSNAENDAVWDVSLVDPHDPQTTTTVEEPAKGEPNEALPEGWKEAHARLDIESERGNVVLQGYAGEPGERATVKEGPVTVWAAWGMGLPRGTLLKGKLQLGETRYFATFTEAQLPGGEKAYPVCVALYADTPIVMGRDEPNCPRGLGLCPFSGSKPSAIKVPTRWEVYAAGYFF